MRTFEGGDARNQPPIASPYHPRHCCTDHSALLLAEESATAPFHYIGAPLGRTAALGACTACKAALRCSSARAPALARCTRARAERGTGTVWARACTRRARRRVPRARARHAAGQAGMARGGGQSEAVCTCTPGHARRSMDVDMRTVTTAMTAMQHSRRALGARAAQARSGTRSSPCPPACPRPPRPPPPPPTRPAANTPRPSPSRSPSDAP